MTAPAVCRWQLAVRDHADLSPGAKFLGLLVSTWMRGDSLKAWPSLPTLVEATGRTRNTVKAWRAELVDFGLLDVEPGGGRGRSTTYTGLLKGSAHAPLSSGERGQSDARKGSAHYPRTPPIGGEHADDAATAGAASSPAQRASRSNGQHRDGCTCSVCHYGTNSTLIRTRGPDPFRPA
jgi:hypothetical protein